MFIQEVDEDIMIRMLIAKDADRLFQITNDSREYLREWLSWVDQMENKEDALSFIQNGFQTYAERSGLTAGVFYKEELVGVTGFNSFDWENKIGYIGYWLAEGYQGNGIMTRVVRTLIDYAFNEFGLNRIDIRTAYDNKKSQAIPEKLGFIKEGHLRQTEWLYDHYVDHIIYGMLKTDWENNA